MLVRMLILFMTFTTGIGATEANSLLNEDKEIRCLALNIYFEARGEPQSGQFAVAAVTMNRVKSFKFPNSVCHVVWQRRQFSWTHDGKSDRPRDQRAWQIAYSLAKLVYLKYPAFQQENNNAWDITLGALHYYSDSIAEPYWAREKDSSMSIGGHLFVRM